ncbi:MAG: response regulator transcription factor [Deltaproteobacteria bacterium]|jgi:DNA-binding response OmpR family regulator|nr:response regulator transcription factor [Deltaproteobacteria bacterium]
MHRRKSKASILIVEDDPAILNGLMDVLVFNGFSAEGVADGSEGLARALDNRFDLLLLDVMLPGVDGFAICRQVRKKRPDQAIMMLTAKGAEDDVVSGFKAGADDYLSKPFSLRELMVRIEAILRRTGRLVGDDTLTIGGIVFDGRNLQAATDNARVDLTRREMDIVAYLYRNRTRIVSKKELLSRVWHYRDATIETRTVDIHMLKLRKKITRLTSGPQLIETVRGEGYRLELEA